jgi:hypothetical protein
MLTSVATFSALKSSICAGVAMSLYFRAKPE